MSDKKSTVPEKNSAQWKKNESIINKHPGLKQARDISEGIEKSANHYKSTHGGKGSAPRTNINSQEWKDAYDQIDWSKIRNTKKNYRVKINGVYVDENEEE